MFVVGFVSLKIFHVGLNWKDCCGLVLLVFCSATTMRGAHLNNIALRL